MTAARKHAAGAAFRGISRRTLITSASAVTLLALSGAARAQEPAPAAPETAPPPAPEPEPIPDPANQFSFDLLSEEMKALAAKEYQAPQQLGGFLAELDYDLYRLIRYDPEKARFANVENTQFKLHAFHPGWLFREPVHLFEVADGQARPMPFSNHDFIYERGAAEVVPPEWEFPGPAGFRLLAPVNRPDIFDELIAFQGASYFRALGRGSVYGLSARGLAINTGTGEPEEFPRFTKFYVERPRPSATTITVWAAMDSPSLTGAYRFVISLGENTDMDVTARLYLRSDIRQLGVAPLTSMYLFGERNRARFDDFRPGVHDSDGLEVVSADGTRLWRPLSNPPHLASSYFAQNAPQSFGLMQRERDFDHYQDAAAHYERRPSLRVTPIGDWGKGSVRLVEIPSELEVNDNIVAFWIPEGDAKAGQMREYRYRLDWGDLPPDPEDDVAYVAATRAGVGGVSGVESDDGSRKFVVDFEGGLIGNLPAEAAKDLKAVITVNNGEIVTDTLSRIPSEGYWRLVMDVSAESGATVELTAHIAGYGRKLSETWAYQWIKP